MDGASNQVVTCSACSKDTTRHYLMCDEAVGEWCPECFDTTPCGRGEHGEGCATAVFAVPDGSSLASGPDTPPLDANHPYGVEHPVESDQ